MISNSKLTVHIKTVHKLEARVEDALACEKDEMVKRFCAFKVEGILKYNTEKAGTGNPVYQRERVGSTQEKLTKCSRCNKFINSSNFYRHKKTCVKEGMSHPKKISKIPVTFIELCNKNKTLNSYFINDILSKLRNDKVGKLCKSDTIILRLGEVFYGKIRRKKDKRVQVGKAFPYTTTMTATMFVF